jgi:SAM-dependent methyltransferase
MSASGGSTARRPFLGRSPGPEDERRLSQGSGLPVTPEEYDAWYRSPRGAWIGETEFRLLANALEPRSGETLLDVGCGTGYFTRLFAARTGASLVGLDPNLAWLRFANSRGGPNQGYVVGRAERLPFGDRSFDRTIAVTSLCFIRTEREALREIVRVTRKRVALGLLNRHSLLYLQKGRHGGSGGYRGAHWHTPREARALFDGMPVRDIGLRSGVFVPTGGPAARRVEALLEDQSLPLGAFLLTVADIET